jgi:hypothetical protein
MQPYVLKFITDLPMFEVLRFLLSINEYESDNINCLCLELRMHEKRLKIPEGQSEVVNRRKTDNTMGK